MPAGSLYELSVKGRLSPRLLNALPGFEVVDEEGGHTRLRGWVIDQSALQGVVRGLGDLCVEIESLHRVDPPD